MKIFSSAFQNNGNIPEKYTCDGENVNPPLSINDVPINTKSLVLIMDDPDAPRGTWLHWTLWNIDPGIKEISENSVPLGAIEGMTDSSRVGYSGPRPPSGTHRYFFKMYALDILLNLPKGSMLEELHKAMASHIVGTSELIGLYTRK